jgi:hypothetical protein
LNATQVTTLTNWVNAGGNLIAMHPDKQLAGLLGLTDANATLANAYLKVDTTAAPGAGIVSATIQYHGTADRYTLNGASAVATLYSNATTATSNPAVTLRSVGSSGGQAAAFTYDLARSVVLTRQGNPAWASQERDGVSGIRPDDLYYGAKSGRRPARLGRHQQDRDPAGRRAAAAAREHDHVDGRDKMPLPALLVPARGEKAGVVMSGDDHSPSQATGGTASIFDRFKALSPVGCSSSKWECVRSTSYIYPTARSRTRRPTRTRGRLRGRAASDRRLAARRRRSRGRARAVYDTQLRSSRRSTRHPAGLEPHPLRLLAGLGVDAEGRARTRDPDGRQLLPLPRRPGSARSPAS